MRRQHWKEGIRTIRQLRSNESDSEWIAVLDRELQELDKENLQLWIDSRAMANVLRSSIVGMSYVLAHVQQNFVAIEPDKANKSAEEIFDNLRRLSEIAEEFLYSRPPGMTEDEPEKPASVHE